LDRAQLYNDEENALRLMLDGRQSSMWTAIPCIVTAVDLAKLTCECQPAIKGRVEDDNGVVTLVNLPLLVDVPVVFPSAGGFIITMPLKVDDEVLVVFASRCIDAWWQSGGIQKPMEARMHDLSDGFAIPGPRSQAKLPAGSVSTTDLEMRNDAGTAVIAIGADGKIKLKGDLTVTGKITATGEVTAMAVSPATAVKLSTHVHTRATPGNPTSVPTPGT
jgi:hypothetical protein